jgi:hypothetical protein
LIPFQDEDYVCKVARTIEESKSLIESGSISALFIGEQGGRLKRNGVYSMVVKYAIQVGLHDSKSTRNEDHFSPHCFRHCFTTNLRRPGMDREFIKPLRGDRRREAIDIYSNQLSVLASTIQGALNRHEIDIDMYEAKYSTLYRALHLYSSARYSLGKIYVVLSDGVERRLRLAIVVRLGGKKGNLSGAIEEAVKDWLGKKWRKSEVRV